MDQLPYVELYVRAGGSGAGRDRGELSDRLTHLDETRRCKEYTVFVHRGGRERDRTRGGGPTPGSWLRARYSRCREWADRNDRELVGFEDRTVGAALTGTTDT